MKKITIKKTRILLAEIDITERGSVVTGVINVPSNTKKIKGIYALATRTGSTLAGNLIKTNKHYWGVAAVPGATDNTFLQTLSKEDMNSKNKVFAANAGAAEYIWYARPTRLGKAYFSIDSVNGGFQDPVTVSVTDPDTGYVENYYVYQSNDANESNVTVFVQ